MKTPLPLAAAVLLLSAACGPSSQLVSVDIADHVDGNGTETIVASVIAADGGHSSGADAVQAAGVGASYAPVELMPLDVCRLITGGPRGSPVVSPKLLDVGTPTLATLDKKYTVSLDATKPARGTGTAYTGTFQTTDMPYDAGKTYTVSAPGAADGPAFGAKIAAPVHFAVTAVGFSQPGPAPVPIPERADLHVRWAPSGSDAEMYILITAGSAGLACRVRDSGDFLIGAGQLGNLAQGAGTITVERYAQDSFDTQIGPGGSTLPGRIRFSVQATYDADLQ